MGLVMVMEAGIAVARVPSLRYVDVMHMPRQAVIVDTRPVALCQQRSLAGAHCIPSGDLLGADGRLPSFADIFWALGTAGLTGKEHVLVVGDNPVARDFVAGVLFLSGQARVMILDARIKAAIKTGRLAVGKGRPRAILRQQIYRAQMRDSMLILPRELSRIQQRNSALIRVNAHQLMNSAAAQSKLIRHLQQGRRDAKRYVIHGRSVRDAIACFTRIRALAGARAAGLRVVPVATRSVVTGIYHHMVKIADGKRVRFQKMTTEEMRGGVDVHGIQPRNPASFAAHAAS